jgi:hypothetical protein
MLHDRLTRQGWAINVKRTYRLYRQEGLMVRQRRRRSCRCPSGSHCCARANPTRYPEFDTK